MTSPIIIARTPEDILRCLEVMQELRTTLQPDEFLTKVQTQQREDGYELVFLEAGDEVRAVAGYRIANSLAWGVSSTSMTSSLAPAIARTDMEVHSSPG
jgi:hypothetical protein